MKAAKTIIPGFDASALATCVFVGALVGRELGLEVGRLEGFADGLAVG